jgi:hypothetical protein
MREFSNKRYIKARLKHRQSAFMLLSDEISHDFLSSTVKKLVKAARKLISAHVKDQNRRLTALPAKMTHNAPTHRFCAKGSCRKIFWLYKINSKCRSIPKLSSYRHFSHSLCQFTPNMWSIKCVKIRIMSQFVILMKWNAVKLWLPSMPLDLV